MVSLRESERASQCPSRWELKEDSRSPVRSRNLFRLDMEMGMGMDFRIDECIDGLIDGWRKKWTN